MRHTIKCLVPTLAAALTLAACGSSSTSSTQTSTSAPAATVSQSSPATTAVVKTASNGNLHATVLTNDNGMTLYTLSGEGNGKFICTSSACLHVWHPLTASASGTPSGSVGSLATVKRSDGTVQVTYKGVPLYTFADDKAPGEDNGQGVKDVGTWSAVTVGATSSTPATQAASEPAKTEAAGSESEKSGSKGGYAY
jgi:predicted lipoprotein with Yx(FWY)xxD motif